MTGPRARRRRGRGGWMSGTKRAKNDRRRIPLWQWLLLVPVIAVAAAAILLYIYVTFVDPKLTGAPGRDSPLGN